MKVELSLLQQPTSSRLLLCSRSEFYVYVYTDPSSDRYSPRAPGQLTKFSPAGGPVAMFKPCWNAYKWAFASGEQRTGRGHATLPPLTFPAVLAQPLSLDMNQKKLSRMKNAGACGLS